MARTSQQLEARLNRLEKQLAELKSAIDARPVKPWFQEIVGSFKNDKAFVEIIRLGRLIRQEKLKR